MATIKSNSCNGTKPAPVPAGVETVTVRETLAVSATDIAINNVLQMVVLPANCIPVDYVLEATDLDTGGPSITLDFGIITTAANTHGTTVSAAAENGGAIWIDNSTVAQATVGYVIGSATIGNYRTLKAVTPVNYDRIIAIVVGAAATTPASGTVGVQLSYRAA